MPKLHRIQTARRSEATSINLAKRRTWYGEGDGAGDPQQRQQGEGELPTTVEGWLKKYEALQKRLGDRDAKIDELNGVNGKLDERIKTIEQAQRKQLEQDGNYKTLAEQHAAEVARLKPVEQRAAALDKIIRESNEERVKAIPDNKKALVSVLVDKLSPEDMQVYLNANPSLFVKEPAPSYDGGAGGNGGGNRSQPKVTDEDKRQAATAQALGHSVKPEDIAKRREDMAKAAQNGT